MVNKKTLGLQAAPRPVRRPLRSRLATVIASFALTGAAIIAGAGPSSAATASGSVAGYNLLGVACSSVNTCVAVGGTNSGQEAVVPISNGVPGSVEPVAGASELAGVACSSVTACIAVGNSPSGGLMVPIVNGAPGTPQPVPGTGSLFGVICASATSCIAVGRNSSGKGVVVPITNGVVGTAQIVPGTWGNAGTLNEVACPSATTCVAVGGDSSSGPGVVVPITNGTPGSLQTVPGTFTLTGVACTSVTTCEGVGTSPPPNSNSAQGVVVPITNGTPGAAQAVPGTIQFNGIACANATICDAVGASLNSSGGWQGAVVTLTNGTPGRPQAPGIAEIMSIACPSLSCVAVGPSFAVSLSAIHTVVSLTFDNAAISQYTLGYQQALAPHKVNATFYINSGIMGGTKHISWSQLSALASVGNDVGGKTVDGTNLTTLTTQQQISEICNDRKAIIQHGLTPVSFAYPHGTFSTTIESEVQGCGYGNARTAGSLSPAGPTYAETMPPKNYLALRAYAPTGQITLANLKALVTGAASHGGGWDPIVIQKVCSQALEPANYGTCTAASGWIELSDLNTFLSWVQSAGQAGGAPAGTTFGTIGSTVTVGHLYWTNDRAGTIVEAGLDGSFPQVIATGQAGPEGLAVSSTHLYWTNSYSPGTIVEAGLDGSNPQVIATGQSAPRGVAVDSTHLYWANDTAGTIAEAGLDGSNPQVIATGQTDPYELAVSSTHLYWTNNGAGTIVEAGLDGSNPQVIATGQGSPDGLAVSSTHLYWANEGGTIVEAGLDGSNPQVIATTVQTVPTGVAVDSTNLYWANYDDHGAGTIVEAGLDGSNPQVIATSPDRGPFGVAVSAS
jgi:sugar lactone lactonase YvrE/peptidoglycan/xylan/chitin deacetylase (PgdA/CDA1 family)